MAGVCPTGRSSGELIASIWLGAEGQKAPRKVGILKAPPGQAGPPGTCTGNPEDSLQATFMGCSQYNHPSAAQEARSYHKASPGLVGEMNSRWGRVVPERGGPKPDLLRHSRVSAAQPLGNSGCKHSRQVRQPTSWHWPPLPHDIAHPCEFEEERRGEGPSSRARALPPIPPPWLRAEASKTNVLLSVLLAPAQWEAGRRLGPPSRRGRGFFGGGCSMESRQVDTRPCRVKW